MHFLGYHWTFSNLLKGEGKKDIRGNDTCFKHAPLEVSHVNISDAFDKRTEHKDRHKHNDVPNVLTQA